MKLFYTKRSPYARKVRIVALEKNIHLDLIDENLTQKSRELLKANPLGKIPTLILDDGQALLDSAVICQYLDGLKDDPILLPRTGWQRMNVLKWEAIADGLSDIAVATYMEKVRHPDDFNAAYVLAQEDSLRQTLKFFDQNIAELKIVSLGSIAVISAVGYLQFRLPHLMEVSKYPALTQWINEFSTRSSIQSTVPVA